jgi:hypothetical protein
MRKVMLFIVAAFFAIAAFAVTLAIYGIQSPTTADTAPSTVERSASASAQPERTGTVAQMQALGSAKAYLDVAPFSRKGLIQQLTSDAGDGFARADAVWAVDRCGADWRAQAVRSARAYLEVTHFSRKGMIQQLTSSAGDGYTTAQATYAADQVGL